MSDDLVVRLREVGAALAMPQHKSDLTDDAAWLTVEAADEIERMRKVIDELAHMEVQEVQRLLTRADINAGRAEQAEAELVRVDHINMDLRERLKQAEARIAEMAKEVRRTIPLLEPLYGWSPGESVREQAVRIGLKEVREILLALLDGEAK